jgi:MHS family proline/betaine transporter-like MFS transporter
LAGVALLAIGAVLSGVVTAPLMSEVFATKTRYTASAITYNLAYTIFGGTAPLVATWLISATGTNLSPAYYLIAVSIFSMIGGLALHETSKTALEEAGPATDSPSDAASVNHTFERIS